LEYLTIAHSHTRWLVERFVNWFGKAAAEALMVANNEAAPNVVRLNLSRGNPTELIARLREQGMDVVKYGLLPETALVHGALDLRNQAFRDGLFTPQSEASQMIAHLLAPRSGATVLDGAAAPGGKSTHLAELVGPQGRVVAIDLKPVGLKRARAVAARLRHQNIDFVCADSAQALPLQSGMFDAVLLDAPCTGLGTLREHPELRWRIEPGDFARMSHLQARMLEGTAELVALGGVLVYSVCSFAPEEGEQVISSFLTRHPEFLPDPAGVSAGSLGELLSGDGAMRTRPDIESRDGFYAMRLRKKS
jgi:16S rRNA (cytosine967-C5)-methyltransferase